MDPWARAVDDGEDASRLFAWRGFPIVVASRLRPNAAADNTVISLTSDDARTNGYVEATVATLATTSDYVGVALRVLSATQHYLCYINGAGAADIQLYNSAFTQLTTTTITLPAVPFTIGGDIADSRIRLFINGAMLLSVSDATLTGPGVFGYYQYAAAAVANVEIDRWEAGPAKGPPAGRQL